MHNLHCVVFECGDLYLNIFECRFRFRHREKLDQMLHELDNVGLKLHPPAQHCCLFGAMLHVSQPWLIQECV